VFTGIIEEIGVMRRIQRQGQAMVLTIGARKVLEDVQLGDSIAVNGVCLTVVSFDSGSFAVDVMPETFRKTNLNALQTGARVNLERAMAVNSRFGGHIVQGHVDTMARIVSRVPEENAVVFRFAPERQEIFKYVLPGGSITIDGISLTVVEVTDTYASVSIIPHTLAQTVLQDKKPGDTVNLETDILGKYVERLLRFGIGGGGDGETAGGAGQGQGQGQGRGKAGMLSAGFLAEHGFM